MYNIDICRAAIEADRAHADRIIASDNNPNGDSYSGKIPFCNCTKCAPHEWPSNIQEQLDELQEFQFQFDRATDEAFDVAFAMQERGEISVEQLRDLFPEDVAERNARLAGSAQCGCVYHAEEGIPCSHDLESK